MSTFSDWLIDQMAIMGMTQVELAKRAGLTTATISRLLSETRQPGTEACEAIARAFNLPAEAVYRKAGLLPEITPRALYEEIVEYRIKQLTDDQIDELMQYIEFMQKRNTRR